MRISRSSGSSSASLELSCFSRRERSVGEAVGQYVGHRPFGQALVEFALVLPVFLLIVFGIIDVGRYVYVTNAFNQAAREAARWLGRTVVVQLTSKRPGGIPNAVHLYRRRGDQWDRRSTGLLGGSGDVHDG